MEDESPNDYIHITRSKPMLLRKDGGYVIGCVVSETNEITAEHRQYHEITDESPSEKDVFKLLLQRPAPRFTDRDILFYE